MAQRKKKESADPKAAAKVVVKAVEHASSGGPITRQIGRMLGGVRRVAKWGLGLAVVYGVLSNKDARKLMGSLMELGTASGKRITFEFGLKARDAIGMTQHEANRLKNVVITTAVLLVVTGMACIFWFARNPHEFYRPLQINGAILFFMLLITYFWAQFIPGLLGLAVAFNWLTPEAAEKLKGNMSSFWAFLVHGPAEGLPDGLRWVKKLWLLSMMGAFWIIVGGEVLCWVPYWRTPELLPKLFPIPFIFMLGTTVWSPLTRGREVSWVLWAQVMILANSALCAVLPEYLYWPIMHNHLWARIGMLVVLLAEGLLCIRITRRKDETNTKRGGYSGAPWNAPRRRFADLPMGWVIVVLAILGFLFLKYDRQWTDSQDHIVTEVANPNINKGMNAVAGTKDVEYVPVGTFGDGRFPPIQPMSHVVSVTGDTVDIAIRAAKEGYLTGISPDLSKEEWAVVFPKGAYTWRLPNGSTRTLQNGFYLSQGKDGSWRERSVAGDLENGRYVTPSDFPERMAWRWKHYIRVKLPEGSFYVRQGNRTPQYAGQGLDWSVSKPWYLGPAPSPDDQLICGLNVMQLPEQNEMLAGLIKVRFIRISTAPRT